MLNIKRCNPWIGCLLVASAALAGCAPKTNVSVTGNVPAQYQHVLLTVQEVWFNTSATATPDDTTWAKFPLTTPVTVDLATSMNGTLTSISSGLALGAGTYTQVRLIPVDALTSLLPSAVAAGALFNSEVIYVDSSSQTHTLPLELQNPEKGIGIQTSLTVSASTTSGNLGIGTSSTSATSTADGTVTTNNGTTGVAGTVNSDPFAGTETANTGATPTTSTGTTSGTDVSTTQSTLPPVVAAVNLDGSRDLVPFLYSAIAGVTLNPHMTAYNTSTAGAITGSLDVSGLTGVTSLSSSNLNIQVTAETLSTDGTRHEQVNSTTVNSDGSFTLYPLSTSTTSTTSYDLVIHGPTMATIIIKGIPVTAGDPSTTTPVSIGTSVLARATTPGNVNLTTTTPLPAGAIVGFYQTIPVSGEVPYLVEQAPIDPYNKNFASAEALSTGTLDYGTYSSGSVSLTAATPTEGAGTFRVAATAPLYADGSLTPTVKPAGGTAVATVAPAALTVESGATATTVPFSVTNSGNFNAGQLIVSHDGAIVAAADLTPIVTGGNRGTVQISLPGGTSSSTYASGLYYVSVRMWNTSSPSTTITRETYPTALDIRSGATSYSLSID
jgi:hypothetical protein